MIITREGRQAAPRPVSERLRVLPLCLEKQLRLMTSALAGQGSCEIGDLWNPTVELSIGESKMSQSL